MLILLNLNLRLCKHMAKLSQSIFLSNQFFNDVASMVNPSLVGHLNLLIITVRNLSRECWQVVWCRYWWYIAGIVHVCFNPNLSIIWSVVRWSQNISFHSCRPNFSNSNWAWVRLEMTKLLLRRDPFSHFTMGVASLVFLLKLKIAAKLTLYEET